MTNAMSAYIGTLVGAAFCAAHFLYGRIVCKAWPPLLRLLGSAIAGFTAIPVLQLGAIVLRPPDAQPVTISVDDHRVTLFLGMFAIVAVSVFALYDNWRAMQRPKRKRRPGADSPSSSGGTSP